jgi:hypothetical protein
MSSGSFAVEIKTKAKECCGISAESRNSLITTDIRSRSRSYFTTDRQPVSQYVLVSSTYCLKFAVLYLWGALSDERTGYPLVGYSK